MPGPAGRPTSPARRSAGQTNFRARLGIEKYPIVTVWERVGVLARGLEVLRASPLIHPYQDYPYPLYSHRIAFQGC
eukprot:454839-Hanusia_phi.AAC.5